MIAAQALAWEVRSMPLPNLDQVSEQDIQALLDYLAAGAGDDPGAKRLVAFRAILSTVAMQAALIERFERRAFLDEAALDSIAGVLTSAYNLDHLRGLFGAPTRGVNLDDALGRITELNNALRSQADAVQTFATIAKVALSIAKVFI